MPSINRILNGLAVTALTLLQVASAAPAQAHNKSGGKPTTTAVATVALSAAPGLVVPGAGDSTAIPLPTSSLVVVAVGRGTQNYSCSAVGATAVAVGAMATLFDATAMASNPTALIDFVKAAVMLPAPRGLRTIGQHFFLADGTPFFELTAGVAKGKSAQVAKIGDLAAPTTAGKGPNGSSAVDWLFLTSKASPYVSVGVSAVYRVETAGGSPATCTAVGLQTVQYAAEYWFYA
ncbi:hypothetical protein BJ878DRAFT_86144 [Calycina marina]|uniref:DUF3455 domain-containing protein n=1 Tax=Calycina marina TaxID=1763456 RepID=A0A9P8CEV5_9HELO|nr:hypothetical protein BJ878DRAFT_86144 [Calycina marina]